MPDNEDAAEAKEAPAKTGLNFRAIQQMQMSVPQKK